MDTTSAPTHLPAASPMGARHRALRNRAWVRAWLYVVLVVLAAIVLVGGATRLTDSGLSITEWKPIHGVIPPLTDAEWQEEFDKYREIPQYQQINKGMSLDEFKTIFWWEWAHRFLARLVGFVFAVPLVFFWATGRIEKGLGPKLLGLLALGGMQGAIGWWMVTSGLVERVSVSQIRLAIHLTLACIIFAAIMAVARSLAPHSAGAADAGTRRFAGFLLLLAVVQVFLGGLVAGLDAGLSYTTWPKMDGAYIPEGLLLLQPAWLNFVDNPKTVQFVHRGVAYLLLALALAHLFYVNKRQPNSTHAHRALVLLGLVLLQAAIGVATLVHQVPLSWALLHQAGALVVLGFAAAHWRAARGAEPLPTDVMIRA